MRPPTIARKAFKSAALLPGLVTFRRPGDVLILIYHRIGAGTREVDLPVPALRAQLSALRRGDRLLSLDEALSGREGGVVVTFDDGYRDFYEHALPVLAELEVPAVLYLATGLVRNGGASGGAEEGVSWGELREAAGTGLVTVGAHTHTHANLARAGEREAAAEMRRSKELIEDALGVGCRHFAYPFAVGSPAAQRAARALFDTAALGAWRTNRAGRIHPYRLGRTPVLRSDGPVFFRAKVGGLLDGEAAAYRILRRGPWRWG